MGQYRVLTRLRRDGREHPEGERLSLPPDEATPLVTVGALVAEEDPPETEPVRRTRKRVES